MTYGWGNGSRRRGTVIPLFAVCLLVIFGFMALAIDTGFIYVCRSEIQRAVDCSALAGASGLYRNDGTAISRAKKYVKLNSLAGTPVGPDEIKITIGNWSGTQMQFIPLSGTSVWTPNAIRVEGGRTGIPLYIGGILHKPTTDVAKGATAVAGGGICAGVWGLEGITADGDIVTDSYDSNAGPYGGGNRHPNGDICSCTGIVFNGGVQIRGDAMYGHGHDLVASGKSYEVWGVIGEHTMDVQPPVIDWADVMVNNDNDLMPLTYKGNDPFNGTGTDLYVTGNDRLVLNGGKFYLTSAMVDGRAHIAIAGPTEFYVAGPGVFTGGGVVNLTGDPKNLIIYSSGSYVHLQGNAAFYGAVVAPDADVLLWGTSEVYGTLLGRTLDFDGNANIHVDEALVRQLYDRSSISPILVE